MNTQAAYAQEAIPHESTHEPVHAHTFENRRAQPNRRRRAPLASKYTIPDVDLAMSILMSKSVEETRPYSQLELVKNRNQMFSELNLSHRSVSHTDCGHSYHVRMYGQKFKEMNDLGTTEDVGNCSVCWKLRRTPRNLKHAAEHFIGLCQDINRDHLTFLDIQAEKIFNTWLYLEQYEERERRDNRRGDSEYDRPRRGDGIYDRPKRGSYQEQHAARAAAMRAPEVVRDRINEEFPLLSSTHAPVTTATGAWGRKFDS